MAGVMRAMMLAAMVAAMLTVPALASDNRGKACKACENVLKDVASFIDSRGYTEEGFEQGLDNICNMLPNAGHARSDCLNFVQRYADDIFEALDGETSPDDVCDVILRCNETDSDALPFLDFDEGASNEVSDSPPCTVCEHFLMWTAEYLHNHDVSEKEFMDHLNLFCEKLIGEKAKKKCSDWVQVHGQDLFDDFNGDISPKEVCSEWGYCKNDTLLTARQAVLENFAKLQREAVESVQAVPSPDRMIKVVDVVSVAQAEPVAAAAGGAKCVMCKLVMKAVAGIMKNKNITEDEFIQDLGIICSKLPEKKQGECRSFVNKYGAEIWRAIDGQIPPAQVCKKMNVCQKSDDEVSDMDNNDDGSDTEGGLLGLSNIVKQVMDKYKMPLASAKGNTTCAMCEFVMKKVAAIVQDKEVTEQQFLDALNKFCNALPHGQQMKCINFVRHNGDNIWRAIDGQTPPEEVCEQLHYC